MEAGSFYGAHAAPVLPCFSRADLAVFATAAGYGIVVVVVVFEAEGGVWVVILCEGEGGEEKREEVERFHG